MSWDLRLKHLQCEHSVKTQRKLSEHLTLAAHASHSEDSSNGIFAGEHHHARNLQLLETVETVEAVETVTVKMTGKSGK